MCVIAPLCLFWLYTLGQVAWAKGYRKYLRWSGGLFEPIPSDWTPGKFLGG